MTDKHREATAAIRSGSGRPMTIRELVEAAERADKRTAAERDRSPLAERLQTAPITYRGR